MTVVISGTSSGLGLELTRCFLAQGDTVVGFSRSASAIAEGARYRHFALDIGDGAAVRAAAQQCGLEALDLLVNNAGLSGTGRRIEEVDPEEVQDLLNVNLFGSLNLVQAFLAPLRRARGRVVNISSRFGSLAFNREPENRALKISYSYRISKAAQNMLAVCLANELADDGIRVNTLHPGSFQSRCGRPDAQRQPTEVAQTIHDWIRSGTAAETLALHEIGGREYGW